MSRLLIALNNNNKPAIVMQVDGLTRLMLGGASEDKEKARHRKENRRETWARGLGKLTIKHAPALDAIYLSAMKLKLLASA